MTPRTALGGVHLPPDVVQVIRGYVKLRKAGKWLPWSNQPAAEIPNLFVFLTLADQFQRAAHGR